MTDIEFKYTKNFNIPYLIGIMLWVNAIKDSAVLVDWPDCVFFKSEIIDRNHDKFSNFRTTENFQKIFFTNLNTRNIVTWHEKYLKDKLTMLEEYDKLDIVFLCAMPMAKLLWIQYDKIIRDLNLRKNIVNIPLYEDKDWLEWYENLLFYLAKNIDYSSSYKKNWTVWVVWNLFDRNEWDCFWNVEEIKRLISMLWLELESIWLSWQNYKELEKIKDCQYIIKMPYWKKAAEYIWSKTWAKIIDVPLPFWLNWTKKFLENIYNNIYDEFISNSNIKEPINIEINNFLRKIKPFLKSYFLWKKVVFSWDPFFFEWVCDICDLLGMEIDIMIWFARKDRWFLNKEDKNLQGKICIWETKAKIEHELENKRNDFYIWNSIMYWIWNTNIDITFPSIKYHALQNRPYFGFKWLENFIERLINWY